MLNEIILELKGNIDPKDKKHAKKIAIAKSKVKCKGNLTPSKVKDDGKTVKFRCTPKDKEKSRKMKKVRKKFNKTVAAKKSKAVAKLTKKYREDV